MAVSTNWLINYIIIRAIVNSSEMNIEDNVVIYSRRQQFSRIL